MSASGTENRRMSNGRQRRKNKRRKKEEKLMTVTEAGGVQSHIDSGTGSQRQSPI